MSPLSLRANFLHSAPVNYCAGAVPLPVPRRRTTPTKTEKLRIRKKSGNERPAITGRSHANRQGQVPKKRVLPVRMASEDARRVQEIERDSRERYGTNVELFLPTRLIWPPNCSPLTPDNRHRLDRTLGIIKMAVEIRKDRIGRCLYWGATWHGYLARFKRTFMLQSSFKWTCNLRLWDATCELFDHSEYSIITYALLILNSKFNFIHHVKPREVKFPSH